MGSLKEWVISEGMGVMPDRGCKEEPKPTPATYVMQHGRGGLNWHTLDGNHYADVMQVDRLMGGDPKKIIEGELRGGQLIQPLPVPGAIAGMDDGQLPQANAVPDADQALIFLIETATQTHYVSMWYELHQLLTGQITEARLIPMTDSEWGAM